jgi:quercetin dioxygenase-like cupin family protein
MSDRFEDHRGVIQDLFDGQPVNVTYIRTMAGAIRGNHVHERTTQWTQILTGKLLMAHGAYVCTEMGPGETMKHDPGDPHAWQAIEDTECLVFTRGPRAGENYEDDTIRLEEPLLS